MSNEKKRSKMWKRLVYIGSALAFVPVILIILPANITKPVLDGRGWINEAYFFDEPTRSVALCVAYHITESTTTARQGSRTTRSSYSWLIVVDLNDGTRKMTKISI